MHQYSIEGHNRQAVLGVIATLSVVAAMLADSAWKHLGGAPWWFDSPSVMGFFGIFYELFNQCIWKLGSIPNFNGTWVGLSESTHDPSTKTRVLVRIRQSYTRILIELETDHSRSRSLMAAIHTSEGIRPGLAYEYVNEPRSTSDSKLHTHQGTALLTLSDLRQERTEGEYYTGRDRNNIGSFSLRRVSKESISKDEAFKKA